MKKTTIIENLRDPNLLITALQNVLCQEFNTTVNENGVIVPFPGSTVGFKIDNGNISSTVALRISNNASEGEYIRIGWDQRTAIDVYYSKKKTAVMATIRNANDNSAFFPPSIIAKDSSGVCVGLTQATINNSSGRTRILCEGGVYYDDVYFGDYAVNPDFALSMVKYPSYATGNMFDEVYKVISAPIELPAGILIHTDDGDFALANIGSEKALVALPV